VHLLGDNKLILVADENDDFENLVGEVLQYKKTPSRGVSV